MSHPIIVRAGVAFEIDPVELIGQSRQRHVCEARNAVAWVLQNNYYFTAQRIGFLLGKRDHTTILHEIKQCNALMHLDPRYTQRVRRVMEAK